MAVKLRLTRVGSKKNPIYRIVAADSRSPRDGKFIEIVGRYNPQLEPSLIEVDEEKVRGWLQKGAQPTEAVVAEVPDDATLVVGGDVAAGPFPSETLERLRALGERVHWLRGNADRELTRGEQGLAPAEVLEWVRTRLSEAQIAFLHGLPGTLELDVDGVGRVLFCHATPENDVDIFTERTPEERIAPQVANPG